MEMVKYTAVTTSCNTKNCATEQKSHHKKGSRVKKLPDMQKHNEKWWMCERDH